MSQLPSEYKLLVEEAVEQTLLKMGLSIATSDDVMELQQDFQHLRRWRKAVGAAEQNFMTVAITLVLGALAFVWVSFQGLLPGSGH